MSSPSFSSSPPILQLTAIKHDLLNIVENAGVVVASEFSTISSLLSGSLKINPFYALHVADTLDKVPKIPLCLPLFFLFFISLPPFLSSSSSSYPSSSPSSSLLMGIFCSFFFAEVTPFPFFFPTCLCLFLVKFRKCVT